MSVKVSNTPMNSTATSFKGGAYNPIVIKNAKIIEKLKEMGNYSTPQNRLIMGATALALQPEIDLMNKDVDEKTRKVSACRTAAKIIIGTITGIVVRQACIDLMTPFTKNPQDLIKKPNTKPPKFLWLFKMPKASEKWETLLIPKGMSAESFGAAVRKMGKHRKALGSIAALGVMLVTNFLIDAPLTKMLTNFFVKKTNADGKADMSGGEK